MIASAEAEAGRLRTALEAATERIRTAEDEHAALEAEVERLVARMEAEMKAAAKALEFERAAALRDEIQQIRLRVLEQDQSVVVARAAERAASALVADWIRTGRKDPPPWLSAHAPEKPRTPAEKTNTPRRQARHLAG